MKFSLMILLVFLIRDSYAQQASDYFPQQTGYKWNYELTVLDSLNNPVPEFNFFRADSFAFIANYKGREAYHILTKTGIEASIPFQPYMDTTYIHLSGSDGYIYYKISELEFILSLLDSTTLNNILPFVGLFESFSDWYLNYRFNSNVNQQYQVASIDTSVTFNSNEIPLRFILNGRRFENENLQTGIGNFLCRKFVLTSSINYLIVIPPLPPIPVPIITTYDTVWIAPDNWIVKDIIPSTNIDLTFVGLDSYTIPGLRREIISEPTGINSNSEEKFTFNLEQNFPNPFNPQTKIKFNIGYSGYVSVKVYDILGKEIVTVLEEELISGSYEILFNGNNLASGLYFYTLSFSNQEHNYSEVKKMLLIK